MHKQPQDRRRLGEALKFFDWAYKKGDKAAEALDYIPMPDTVVAQVEEDLGDARSRAPTASRCTSN